MKEKCALCNTQLEENYIGKLVGTRIKIVEKDKARHAYVCPTCQKEHKDTLKDKIK